MTALLVLAAIVVAWHLVGIPVAWLSIRYTERYDPAPGHISPKSWKVGDWLILISLWPIAVACAFIVWARRNGYDE